MNHKYRMYLLNLSLKFQKEAEIYRDTDSDIAKFAAKMASYCYTALSDSAKPKD